MVYLAALQRAQKHLSIVGLVCDLKSGAEIYVSEDLFLFIIDLFKDWNTWLESGRYEITKGEEELYMVRPKKLINPKSFQPTMQAPIALRNMISISSRRNNYQRS